MDMVRLVRVFQSYQNVLIKTKFFIKKIIMLVNQIVRKDIDEVRNY